MKIASVALWIAAAAALFSFTQIQALENSPMIVILLGAPGSGKGTQAKKLALELQIPHISTGDLFRENLAKGTPLGNEVRGYIEAGKYVPDEIVVSMLKERVSAPDSKKGYLLDGFPRTLRQAEVLDAMIAAEPSKPKLMVLELAVPDEAIVKRVAGRVSCKQCGAVYNIHFFPPKEAGKCDSCQGELYQRSDDNAEVVAERLKTYHEQTAPLINYYKKKGVLVTVDGNRDPQIVFDELRRAF